jgi:hypothetical protein
MGRADKDPLMPEGGDGSPDGGRPGDNYSGKAKMVVRLVAGGFILVGALDVILYWAKCKHDQTTPEIWRCVYLSIPLVIGVAILIKTPALAQRIEDWLEE